MNESHPNVRVGVGVFVIKDSKFLMLQRKGSHGAGTWSIVGGHQEFGESFEETAKRETMEEAGLTIKNVRFTAVTNDVFEAENKHYVTIWLVSEWESGQEYIVEPEKCVAMDWFSFDTLPFPLILTWNQLFASEFLDKVKAEIGSM